MGFNIKDFFYFHKNDRNAIVILLLLIIVCGLLLINKQSVFKEDNVALQEESLNEFNTFKNEIVESPSISAQTQADTDPSIKTSLSKLKDGETIDLNASTVESLKRIPGIGEEYARRIFDYKTQLGGFTSVDQLKEIKGFSGKRFDKIIPYVSINKSAKKIKINKQSKEEMLTHPYLTEKQAACIVEVRQVNGKIRSVDELLLASEFAPRDAERLLPYLSFD